MVDQEKFDDEFLIIQIVKVTETVEDVLATFIAKPMSPGVEAKVVEAFGGNTIIYMTRQDYIENYGYDFLQQ